MCRPLYIWLFKQKEHRLQKLYNELCDMEPGYITNQFADIDIHPMDFWTGETDPSLIQFFAPDTDTIFKIANTPLDPEDPLDDPFTRARDSKYQVFVRQEMHHSLHMAFSKYLRKSPGGSKSPDLWSLVSMRDGESLFNSNDRHGFTIENGAKSADGMTSHQLVVMKSQSCYHEILPSVGELLVLVRWMLSGIKNQKRQFSRYHRHERPQLEFPTMIMSFLPNARVRVLHGYFDGGQLKVAYTQALNFDAEDYTEKMDVLLQWAWPLAEGHTSKPIPLPTIEDDEEDEWDEWEKWELRYREDREEEWSDTDDGGDSTGADQDLSDCESEVDEEDEIDVETKGPIEEWSDQPVMSTDIRIKIIKRLDEKLKSLGKLGELRELT
ncbi:uncharacterized protein N7479_006025 [Penicillium vulpinum]|uniref:Uncharacterized protein n=1 Tax=Penicillium vulpinum TaxID=29845 RepID=A0A1V6SF71_9EURO|nr:uncharacterized protein N7479_006025 [Penicillium vulpinum]KAJ5958875.1 hypothetical protein N7479_006025 [Penicillium vulpinum]OQE12662.1 hypothetical protein PENVUL_c001G00457 [Penicillium vulpinum]